MDGSPVGMGWPGAIGPIIGPMGVVVGAGVWFLLESGENALLSLGLNLILALLEVSARLGEGVEPPAAGSSPSSHAPHPCTEST